MGDCHNLVWIHQDARKSGLAFVVTNTVQFAAKDHTDNVYERRSGRNDSLPHRHQSFVLLRLHRPRDQFSYELVKIYFQVPLRPVAFRAWDMNVWDELGRKDRFSDRADQIQILQGIGP